MTARQFPVISLCTVILFSLSHAGLAQWQKTTGPPGMNVNVFYQRGSILFAGTSPKGVFKSTDNGVTWSAANSGIEEKNVFALTADSNFVFAGTDSGVYRSKNNGKTWQAASAGIEGKFVYSFCFGNGYLFAGTGWGLYRSSNEGKTWTDANGSALTSSTIHDLIFTDPYLVVIADNLLFYSDNNGDAWYYNYNSPFILGDNPSFLARKDSVLLASGTGIFRSFDGGINWGKFITVAPDSKIDGVLQVNQYIVAGTARGMYYSLNFGRTWNAITPHGLRYGTWFTHDFYKSGNNFLLAYDEIGVGYSGDAGRNWNYTLNNFPPVASIDNAMLFSNNILITGTHGDGLYKTSDAGSTWIKFGTTNDLDTLSNSNIYAVLKSGNVLLAGTCGNGLYRSADNGVTWVRIRSGLPQQSSGYLCVQSLAKTTNAFLAATDQGLYYSSDLGLTWHPSNLGNVDVVAVAANDSVACAAVENLTSSNKIYRSVNNPASWSIVFESFLEDWASLGSDGSTHFYAGTLNSGNYVSKNDGLTWQSMGPGIPPGTGGFAIVASGKNVFLGNISGVYFSNNNGTSFTGVNTGFDANPAVQGLAISPTTIYAGLFLNSIWKRPLSDFGIVQPQQQTNSSLFVTVTPNPMINESKLYYRIESQVHVVINIYDANGNLSTNIVDAIQSPGSHTVTINKTHLTNGNYFVSVIAGDKHGVVGLTVAFGR